MYYYTSKEFENYIKVFSNSIDLKTNLIKESISLTPQKIKTLVEFFLSNKDTFDNLSIEEILTQNPISVREKTADALGKKFVKDIVLRSVVFTFKYASVRCFFYASWRQYIPEYDYDMIMASDKKKVFFNAMMKELDRIDDAITAMYQAFDIDQIPYKYLEYLASLIGYQSEDKNLVKDYVFRDLIKNMIEIYKVKGSNYSFELFLTFLGFDVTIDEYWFDRRFYWKQKNAINEFTNEKRKYFSGFYLTPTSPESYHPSSLIKNETVFKSDIKETMDLNQFNRYFYEGGFTDHFGNNIKLSTSDEDIGYLLGYTQKDGKYFEDPYTYFKTNVVKFNFSSFKENKDQAELTTDDIKIINRIFEFLLPIFVERQTVVMINDWEENINPDSDADSLLNFLDKDLKHIYINTDYQEVDGFDPIYEETKRWDSNLFYSKDSIVIYDNSVDFRLYMTVENGDVVIYQNKYYKYNGEAEKTCTNTPPYDSDFEEVFDYPKYYKTNTEIDTYDRYDYINIISEDVSDAVPFVPNMELTTGLIIEHNQRYYKYTGIGETAPEIFYDVKNLMSLNDFYMSKTNYNSFVMDNTDAWLNFVPNDFVLEMTINPENIVWYDNAYYYYRRVTSKNAGYYPSRDPDFIKLELKRYNKGTPTDNTNFWEPIEYNEAKDYFSVFDRVKRDEGKTNEQTLKKIAKMLTAVSVRSRELTDFSGVKGKYLIFKFPIIKTTETTKRYAQARTIDLDDPTEVFEEEVLIINDGYYYCHSRPYPDGILTNDNYTNCTYPIIDNYAINNGEKVRYIPLFDNSITVNFDTDIENFSDFCQVIIDKFNENISGDPNNPLRISDYYDFTQKENYFIISSKLDVEFEEEPYISIIYDFIKTKDKISLNDDDGNELVFVIDSNNLYNIFPSHFTSPRYRDDFTTRTLSGINYSAKIRSNYITETYPCARFATGKIIKTDVVTPYFDTYSSSGMNYSYFDNYLEDPFYPLLCYGFVFDDKQPKCYKDFYPTFNEYDIKTLNSGESTIGIDLVNVVEVPIKEGQEINVVFDYNNNSYEDKYEVLESTVEPICLVDRDDLVSLLENSGMPGDPEEIVT